VKDNFLINGFVLNSYPMPEESVPVTTFNTPAGHPAFSARTARANAVKGVCDAGRCTTVQPAAIAGAIFLVTIANGKFHAVIAATTTTPCLIVSILFDIFDAGTASP